MAHVCVSAAQHSCSVCSGKPCQRPFRASATAPTSRRLVETASCFLAHVIGKSLLLSLGPQRNQSAGFSVAKAVSSGESATTVAPDMTKTKVLFVCLGNICRSPTAEAVFKKVVDRSGLADEFTIDSCGTGGGNEDWYKLGTKDGWSYHVGHDADERMNAAAEKRDIHLTSKSRPLEPEDFDKFDFIIGMDYDNSHEIKKAAQHWRDDLQKSLSENWKDKITLMCNYMTKAEYRELKEVPDPYFGGAQGFEKVLDLLEDACEGLLSHIESSMFATES